MKVLNKQSILRVFWDLTNSLLKGKRVHKKGEFWSLKYKRLCLSLWTYSKENAKKDCLKCTNFPVL